jgi:hypothetical protein
MYQVLSNVSIRLHHSERARLTRQSFEIELRSKESLE